MHVSQDMLRKVRFKTIFLCVPDVVGTRINLPKNISGSHLLPDAKPTEYHRQCPLGLNEYVLTLSTPNSRILIHQ